MQELTRLVLIGLLGPLCLSGWALAATMPDRLHVDDDALFIEDASPGGSWPVPRDAIGGLIVAGKWPAPKAGQEITGPDGKTRVWKSVRAEKGVVTLPKAMRGYVYLTVGSERERVMRLDLHGCRAAMFNGAWHPGGTYPGRGIAVPVRVRKGQNELLVEMSPRGGARLHVWLSAPGSDFTFGPDLTPALIAGEKTDVWVGAGMWNMGRDPVTDLTLTAQWPDGPETVTKLDRSEPVTFRRTAFRICGPVARAKKGGQPGYIELDYELTGKKDGKQQKLAAGKVGLRIIDLEHLRADHVRLTYRSSVDGSVQYYMLRPAKPLPRPGERPAMFLTMHGAGVEAKTHASSYWRKSWGHVVAPTNRERYGYGWEGLGRIDALEVAAEVERRFHTDPRRTYATGHSMGGHGSWHLGVLYPDKFAAIGPSAGYPNRSPFRSPGGPKPRSAVEQMFWRAAAPSNTEALLENLLATGVYILHGGRDGNVRPEHGRRMAELLRGFHHDFRHHEEPGAGHWWTRCSRHNTGRVPCTDWDEMFDFFARRRTPEPRDVTTVTFITPNPEVTAWNQWLGIEAQRQMMKNAKAVVSCKPRDRAFFGKTQNVARISFRVDHLEPGPISVGLDGPWIGGIPWPEKEKRIWLERVEGAWKVVGKPSPKLKGPHRYGPFTEAFKHDMVFVYGTAGTPEENAWAFAKARFDGEQLWYQGGGSADLVPDTAFEPKRYADRSVILYGNADTNAAWKTLLGKSPVQVTRGRIGIGKRILKGADLACLFIRPRPDSDVASVAVVGGTGPAGLRLTDRLPYMRSGAHYPDCTVLSPKAGAGEVSGVKVAGFFGIDWSVEAGDFAWWDNAPERYTARRAAGPIKVDGKLDEDAWTHIPWTRAFVDIQGDRLVRPEFETRVKMTWDDKYFYVAAKLEEPHVWGTKTVRNTRIYDDNDFEVFIDPDGDAKNYYEFEMNALNTVWNLLLFKPYSKGGGGLIPFDLKGQKSGVFVKGTVNNPSDTDEYWTVEVAFPWTSLKEYANRACPPKDGDVWRVNFSRVQYGHKIVDGRYQRQAHPTGGGNHPEANWVWSPQGRINMHQPETWGYVRFSTPAPEK